MKKPIKLSTFNYKGQDFDVLVDKGEIKYLVQIGNERYGIAVKPKSRSVLDISDAVFNLLINFIETYESKKGDSK